MLWKSWFFVISMVANNITKVICYHHSLWDLKYNKMILKIYRTEIQAVKILQMFWQPFRTLIWQNFVLLQVMESQEFSKQFLFQKPNNNKLFVFSYVKTLIPNQCRHIFFQIILQYGGFNWVTELFKYLEGW